MAWPPGKEGTWASDARNPVGCPSFSSRAHRTLLSPKLLLYPFRASLPRGAEVPGLPHVLPVEIPAYLSSRLVLPRLRFAFPCRSFSSCWASACALPRVAAPAIAPPWALQGRGWLSAATGRPRVVRSGARGVAAAPVASSPPWQELGWKPLDPSCLEGANSRVLRASLPRGCVRAPFSPQPGPEAKISPGGALSGLP